MADPKAKSLQIPPYLQRNLPLWQSPEWLSAERWRRVVRQQPVAVVCRDTLITFLQALPWEIRPREPKDEDKLAEEILHYTHVLNTADDADFDIWLDKMWQDALDLPIGGNTEIVRYPDGFGPFSNAHPKGHVFKIVHMDGATMMPSYDDKFPWVQRHRGDVTNTIVFKPNEVGRLLLSPRPELERKYFGMAPPERIYLAITMLYHGDRYYANLLLDTPEAGLLDLIDMDQETAEEWLSSFRELLGGIDPFKIPVLYEHATPAQWIPFGRPPTEMLYDSTTLKYAKVTAAGYWLTLTDIGMESQAGGTLAGVIRNERKARRTGFGLITEKTRNLINHHIMPPYLEWTIVEQDEEALVQMGRARLLNAQAMKAYGEAGVLSQEEARDQVSKDGLITIEIDPSEVPEKPMPQAPGGQNGTNGTGNETDKVPAEQGGRGDLTGKAITLGDPKISAVPKGSEKFDFMANTLKTGFDAILLEMTDARLKKLIHKATQELFPSVKVATNSLSNAQLRVWREERLKLWFDQESHFDELPTVAKSKATVMDNLDDILSEESWWKLPDSITEAATLAIKLAFEEGGTVGAGMAQHALYAGGKEISPDISLNFDLKNEATLAQLRSNAAKLVTNVDDGTRFFIKRVITAGVEEGLASPKIAEMIRNGAGVDDVLRDTGYTRDMIEKVRNEVAAISENRANSIANTEIARAETDGRIGQWRAMGLKKKDGSTPALTSPAPTVSET